VDLIQIAPVAVLFVGLQFLGQVAAVVIGLMIWERIHAR